MYDVMPFYVIKERNTIVLGQMRQRITIMSTVNLSNIIHVNGFYRDLA